MAPRGAKNHPSSTPKTNRRPRKRNIRKRPRKWAGRFMENTRDLGCETGPKINLGICGEHGGEPQGVKFCHRLGLDCVSCNPFRVPIAKLAAAGREFSICWKSRCR